MQETFKILELGNNEMYNEITKVFLISEIVSRRRVPTIELWMA